MPFYLLPISVSLMKIKRRAEEYYTLHGREITEYVTYCEATNLKATSIYH